MIINYCISRITLNDLYNESNFTHSNSKARCIHEKLNECCSIKSFIRDDFAVFHNRDLKNGLCQIDADNCMMTHG